MPYSGTSSPDSNYPSVRQPTTYSERVTLAIEMEGLLQGTQMMWVDELAPEPRNNPVWYNYGPSPVPGWVIDMDGKIIYAPSDCWLNVNSAQNAIDSICGS